MISRRSALLGMAAAGLLMAAGTRAQMLDDSPFVATSGRAAATQNTPIEFRGIMPTDKGLRFCIYDAARKTSKWVAIDERLAGTGFIVKSADLKRDTISVQNNGQLMTLALQKSKVSPSGPMVMGGGEVMAGHIQGEFVPPTSQEEQARLQAVADEVKRRREARLAADAAADAQAAAQAGQGGQQMGPQNAAPPPRRGAPPGFRQPGAPGSSTVQPQQQ